ncbi:MAG: hypothetical protein AAGA75_06095 [Cyanobacteria bacterium P01_E01_bin.6]
MLIDIIGFDLNDPDDAPPLRPINSGGNPPNPERIPEPSSAIALLPIAWFGFKWLRRR